SLESLLDSGHSANKRERELSRVTGKTVQFNIRSGIDAQDPVPDTYVFLPMIRSSSSTASNMEMLFGYRRGIVQKSLLNGSFEMPVEIASFNPQPHINAYTLDRADALFRKVATEGQVGTKPQTTTFSYRAGEAVLKNLVMIDVYPRVIFPGVNPSTYKSVFGGAYNKLPIELVDAVINGPPRDFAVDNPLLDFAEIQSDGVVLYLQRGDRVRVMIRQGLDYFMVLTGPVVEEADGKARGQGITIGPDGDDRSLYLALTPYEIARGMWDLASHRLALYESFGISSKVLRETIDRSGEKLERAEAAIAEADWQEAIGNSREAWGMLVKNFPRILKLGREAVFSVILLMALAVPASAFLERLVIGSKSIVARLTGTSAIFIGATLFLNAFHPAFKISLSPFIIVIAFTMILMSLIVLVLSYSRFEVVLRRFRSAGGQVESEEISLMSSLSTAFSLGVSNLKKRSFRTALTVFTVTALTFSIVGFVAVQGSDALTRTALPLNDRVEGETVDPIPPPYDGFMIRSPNWLQVSQSQVSAIESEFGATGAVTVRAHYIETEGGNNANREGVNQIPLTHGEARHIVTGIMAFQPNETEFTGLHEAVSGGEWFRPESSASGEPGDRRVIILPDTAAADLGITKEMILDEAGNRRPAETLPAIRMSNQEWKVIGILDTAHANRIRDVNGQSLAMVDYLASGMSSGVSGSTRIISEGQAFHFDWSRLVIVPFMARQDVGAKIRSVAVKLPDSLDSETLFADLTKRLKNEFFVASDGEVSLVVPQQQVNFAGIAKILLPVLLCVLIVMNTMLGTVEERKGEVGMLGAIGLSPRQIAFLMFAESTVFSILGIIFGTFGGLLFANIVNAVNAAGGNFLTSLSFNFTSLISMSLATGTGFIVLLATLIPANKAAALAAPSGMTEWELPEAEVAGEIRFKLPFTLTRGNAVGMVAFFRQFLINHNEPTSEDFNCREVFVRLSEHAGKPVISLSTDMWLAPYDLDVAQHFALNLSPGTRESVYEVELVMNRFSGSEENSRRTAYNYLNLVRRQFLLWRNLEPERRTDFIGQGAELMKRSASTPVSHE
ncbi:MAG TPA: ABC transporter permease, partial [Oceanipulchritudo sp.]|nr:ABC transporter permease [Oceanipulchritudo sp.]